MPKATLPPTETVSQPTSLGASALSLVRYFFTLFLLAFSLTANAQYTYSNNNGAITITGYSGNIDNLNIPATIDGLPVKVIWDRAFVNRSDLKNLEIPDGVTSIGAEAFAYCTSLTSVIIPNSVTIIDYAAFGHCSGLTSVVIPNRVTSIGAAAFSGCSGLASVTIPVSVTNVQNSAFSGCSGLTSVTLPTSLAIVGSAAFVECTQLKNAYFKGNRPELAPGAPPNPKAPPFTIPSFASTAATIYYLPGSTGWGAEFAGRPTALWDPSISIADSGFGLSSGNFGFKITGSNNIEIVMEFCEDLFLANWLPMSTNILANGFSNFTDPTWTNHPSRIYRFRSP